MLWANFTGWIPIYMVTIHLTTHLSQHHSHDRTITVTVMKADRIIHLTTLSQQLIIPLPKSPYSSTLINPHIIPPVTYPFDLRHKSQSQIQLIGINRVDPPPPRPRTTVKVQLLLIPEAQDLDNGSWRYEWTLDSRMYLDEGCHAPCTGHFTWNRQDPPIVGK